MRVFIWSQTGYSPTSAISQVVISFEELSATITTAIAQALTPINQRLEQIEMRLNALPVVKPTRPWTLPASTPLEEVPSGYQQLEDGSWLSPSEERINPQTKQAIATLGKNEKLGTLNKLPLV